jgi:hypothetical protein
MLIVVLLNRTYQTKMIVKVENDMTLIKYSA